MTDILSPAVAAWNRGESARWDFAPLAAAALAERQGSELARQIMQSPDTVESYARVDWLWDEMITSNPAFAELWRADLKIGHWVVVGRVRFRRVMPIERDDAADWLDMAYVNQWSVDELRRKLPRTGTRDLPYRERLNSYMDRIENDLINAESYGAGDDLHRRAHRVLVRTVWFIRRLLAEAS